MQNRLAYICLPELFSAKERPWMKKSDQWKLQMAAMDVDWLGLGQGLRTGTQSSGLQLFPCKLDHKFKRDYCFAALKRIENSFFFTLD